MRVLFLSSTDWYLYNFRLDLARAVRDAGHEVVFVAPEGEFASRIEADGFAFRPITMSRRGVNPFGEIAAIRRLTEVYREIQPDLAHHFTLKAVVQGSLAARRAGVQRVVNAVAGLGYVFTDPGLRARAIRLGLVPALRVALRGTETIYQNPDDQALLVRARAADPARSHLIRGSGVDVSRFSPTPEAEGPPLVVLASRMLWGKGVGDFAEAARLVREAIPDARLALVGPTDEGNPGAVPEAQLREWVSAGHVEWWGFRDDMEAILASAHVVCLPSRYGEGVPRILIEAAATGRALVATDIAGCREIVRDGETGRLVPHSDPLALADALVGLLRDPDARRRMGAQARDLAVREFSAREVIARTMGVYDRFEPTSAE